MPRRTKQDEDLSDDEAREEIEHVEDEEDQNPISEESGEDLIEDQEKDYKIIPVILYSYPVTRHLRGRRSR